MSDKGKFFSSLDKGERGEYDEDDNRIAPVGKATTERDGASPDAALSGLLPQSSGDTMRGPAGYVETKA